MLNHSTLSSVSSSKENHPPIAPSHPTAFSSATPARIIPQNSLRNSYPPAYAHPPPPGSSPSQASYTYYHPIPPSSNHILYSQNAYGHPLSTPMDYPTPNTPYSHSHYPSQNHTAIPTLFTYSSSPYTSSNHSGHQPIPSTSHNISTESSFNPQLTPYSQFSSHNTSHSTYFNWYCLYLLSWSLFGTFDT